MILGLLDTGIDLTHSNFENNVDQFASVDRYGNVIHNKDCYDSGCHGTHIFGIICDSLCKSHEDLAATVKLNVVAIEQTGKIILNLLKGMDIMLAWEVQIACMPIGIKPKTPIFKPLIDAFEKKGVLVIVPIGNGGDGKYYSPGWYPNVLSVGAVDHDLQPAKFSGCYYDKDGNCLKPDILAPGVEILSTAPGNKLAKMSGTSMACAFVTRVAAKILEANPNLTAHQIKAILIASAAKMPKLPHRHYNYDKGIVDLDKALKHQLNDNSYKDILDNYCGQIYVDPYFYYKYSYADENEVIESILGIKENFKKKDSRSLGSANNAIKEFITNYQNQREITYIEFFNNVNMAYAKASKNVYNELLENPVISMISAVDINIFGF
jgi:subtilisin family serine protease